MKVLLFGGTRFMGRYVFRALSEIGAEVTIANRGSNEPNPGANNVICDRSQAGALDQFKDSSFDVIIDFSAYASDWVKTAGDFFANRIGQYIFISSGAVYSNTEIFPITEDFPLGEPHPFAPYAAEKLRSENYLVEYSKQGVFNTASCRLPYVLGPENYEDRESFAFSRLLKEAPILLANGGHAIHPFVYAADVAAAIVSLIQHSVAANGQAFNIAASEIATNAGFVQLASEICGKSANIIAYNPSDYDLDPNNFDLKNVTFPFPELNAYLSSDKIARITGFRPQHGVRQMLEIYYHWWLKQGKLEPKEYALENRILQSLGLI